MGAGLLCWGDAGVPGIASASTCTCMRDVWTLERRGLQYKYSDRAGAGTDLIMVLFLPGPVLSRRWAGKKGGESCWESLFRTRVNDERASVTLEFPMMVSGGRN